MKRFLLLLISLTIGVISYGQYNPQFQVDVTVSENFNHNYGNFQFLIQFDTQAEIAAGNMNADGSDIRFGEPCFSSNFNYWIESGINTPNTRIWVNIPNVSANDVMTVTMYYGDSAATAESDFNATFPNAIISSGNITLSGDTTVGWLEISAGDELNLGADTVHNIYAAYVKIDGSIMGDGMGYPAAPAPGPTTGAGPGGGTASTNSGAGGGSYGGIGGTGGSDAGDTPGIGGPTYGGRKTMNIQKGSAGGTAPTIAGGNGGGAIAIYAQEIVVNGNISVNGDDAVQPGAPQGAAAGSGGGVLLAADVVTLTGGINADGGDGSVGTSSANDDGGGGGGGRVKILSGSASANTGSISVLGGIGGPNGGTPAFDGGIGTMVDTLFGYTAPSMGTVGPAVAIDNTLTTSLTGLTSNTPNATYQWLDCSVTPPVAIPNETNQTYLFTGNGSFSVAITNGGCTDTSNCFVLNNFEIEEKGLAQVDFYPNPATSVLNFDLPVGLSTVEISIFDQTGKKVLHNTLTHSERSLAVGKLPKGIYIMSIKDDSSVINKQFVKQ